MLDITDSVAQNATEPTGGCKRGYEQRKCQVCIPFTTPDTVPFLLSSRLLVLGYVWLSRGSLVG